MHSSLRQALDRASKSKRRLVLLAMGILLGVTGCIFSPEKKKDGFPLSARVWDGVEIDSSGQKTQIAGTLRLQFLEEGRVKVQVGHLKGEAPFAVRNSGKVELGFEDEPLVLLPSITAKAVAVKTWLPDFLSHADRYKEQDGKLYFRTTLYPDVLLTLAPGDTADTVGSKPDPTKPQPMQNLDSVRALLKAYVWKGISLDSTRVDDLPLSLQGLIQVRFVDSSNFEVDFSCRKGVGQYRLEAANRIAFLNLEIIKDCKETLNHIQDIERNLILALKATHTVSVSTRNLSLISEKMGLALYFESAKLAEPPVPSSLILPDDFPVFGGQRVPQARKAIFDATVAAWGRWKHSEIAAYHFQFQEGCLKCGGERDGAIYVQSGKVVGFKPTDILSASSALATFPTVEALYGQLGWYLTQPTQVGEIIQVTFDIYGAPKQFWVDPNPEFADDTYQFLLGSFGTGQAIEIDAFQPVDPLSGKDFEVTRLQFSGITTSLIASPQISFTTNGQWTAQFQCNTFTGTYAIQTDGLYAFKLGARSQVDCGETPITETVASLLRYPVQVTQEGVLGLRLSSQDGLTAIYLTPITRILIDRLKVILPDTAYLAVPYSAID